ncbi:hypothetical protein GGI43DRAFT_310100 [Trichoderma evansii]
MVKYIGDIPFKAIDALDTSRLASASVYTADTDENSTSACTPQYETRLISYIPGEETIPLVESNSFLQKELATPVIDELYNVLHLFARKLSSNIDSLHEQIVKGRSVIITETPRFHLVRQEKSIFVKPVPLCLFNYNFWEQYLASNTCFMPVLSSAPHSYDAGSPLTSDSYRSMALGFLRSYAQLIQHQSDLRIAKEQGLIPEYVTWARWCKFICGFRLVSDEDVARRYHYGQIRLTRLNWAIFIFRPKSAGKGLWFYRESPWSAPVFIRYFAVPLAFIFASVSLVLSSMQVMITVPEDVLYSSGISEDGFRAMELVAWWFSIVTLVFAALSSTLLLFVPILIIIYQICWGIWKHRRK